MVDDWMRDALCAGPEGQDVEFFPDESTGAHDQGAAAQDLCRRCDVRPECLHFALDLKIDEGVWGGMTARDRRKIKRRRAA